MKIALLFGAAIAGLACVPGDIDPGRPSAKDAGGDPPSGISDETALGECPRYPTVGAFERGMIVPRCGTGTCHSTNGRPFAPDMSSRPIHPRLLDRNVMGAATACDRASDRYVDSRASADESYLVAKVRDDHPLCPSGKPAGARMPLAAPPLAPDEIACFVSYVRALIGP